MSLLTKMRKLEKEAFFFCFILLYEYLLFCREDMIGLVLGKWNDPVGS